MSLRDELVRLTMDLVAIPSVSDDPQGREDVIAYIERFCAALPGVRTSRHESDGKPSLVAAFDDAPAKSLILNAHVDVVPGRPDQFRPQERDGRIYGRGTQDMKAAGAAMLLLLKNLAEEGVHPNIAWQFVTDEEIGGEHGTAYLFGKGYTGEFFVAGEPTDLEIVNRAKGILWLTLRQHGNPAHGSRPWDGDNPIVPIAEGIGRLLEHYPIPAEPVWRTTATVTTIHGGDAQNRVPVECVLGLDIRRVPEETEADVFAKVQACFPDAEVMLAHNGSALETAKDDVHVQRLAQAARSVGVEAGFRNEHFASDARFYSEASVPAVCFGPVGAGLHSHDEWVDIASLEQYYRVLDALARMY
jgi:succinyl-diaminopimelate desuccinylase